MLTRIAGLDVGRVLVVEERPTAVLLVMMCQSVRVSGRTVVMFWVIVADVSVHVQPRRRPQKRQRRHDQRCCHHPKHSRSLWHRERLVKPSCCDQGTTVT